MQEALVIYTIYDHPSDYPDNFVVRRWSVVGGNVKPDDSCILANSLEEARSGFNPGMTRIPRLPQDDQVIVELWI